MPQVSDRSRGRWPFPLEPWRRGRIPLVWCGFLGAALITGVFLSFFVKGL